MIQKKHIKAERLESFAFQDGNQTIQRLRGTFVEVLIISATPETSVPKHDTMGDNVRRLPKPQVIALGA